MGNKKENLKDFFIISEGVAGGRMESNNWHGG